MWIHQDFQIDKTIQRKRENEKGKGKMEKGKGRLKREKIRGKQKRKGERKQ